MQYQYKTKPFPHQAEVFERTCDDKFHALFWEQGCGKTKPTIDTAAYQYLKGSINTLLVVAPNGVHRNWVSDELPTHLPDTVAEQTKVIYWETSKANQVGYKKQLKELLDHKGLAVLTISYEGFMTKAAKNYIWKLLQKRKVFYVLDEGHKIKEPGAKRTISIIASSKYAAYRRLLTGTPIAKGPFDIYAQVRWLCNQFWRDRGFLDFATFKNYFGIYRKRCDVLAEEGYDPGYDQLLGYKNIEEIEHYVKEIGHRLTKETAGLNLPPKLYQKRYFEMSKEQQQLYQQMKDEFLAELASGQVVMAPLAIVRLLKLQQITCNYIVTDIDEPAVLISGKNPRLETLKEIVETLTHPAIIWARFTKDIDQIMEMLGDSACRYDGAISDDACAESKRAFQAGEKQFFVGNPAKGSTGLTLVQAKTVIYYSNNFKLIDRLQSEDRAHRIGQNNAVNYIDIICPGTIDEHIVKNLRNKFDIATKITGDELKEWL